MHTRISRAFTLVELLLVVLILGLLAAVAIPRLAHSGRDTRANACLANTHMVNTQIEIFASTNGGQYPADENEFTAKILKNADIFPDGAPQCPYGAAYVYDAATRRVVPHPHKKVTAEASEAETKASEANPP